MKTLSVKNFEQFQHYKDRTPPWIKLYNELLEDYEFSALKDTSKAHLMLIWLLASRSNNQIPYDAKWIANKIGANTPVDLDALLDSGFLIEDGEPHQPADWGSRYIKKTDKDAVWERDGGACTACGSRKRIEYDHIIPVSKGGTSAASNLQLLCASCNRKKRVRSTRYADTETSVQTTTNARSLERETERETEGEKRKSKRPRDFLLAVLDEERADAVIDHRQRMKAALTPHAAKLLAAKLSKTGDANENADTMIARGWRGFEPEWLESKKQDIRQNGSGVYIRKGSRQWKAWEDHGRKVHDERMLASMKATPDGGERKFKAEWPSRAY